ncbi:GNAT family N-acetyltransferase [Actinomyces radicidentis]|uniref:GNAT family N-acetyltransferase n=1 Tax=Actinomyces radicidentis TaxID=111015 RepID=UPI0026E03F93|nr:GNAT family protein [Actinomyces radicidentis]
MSALPPSSLRLTRMTPSAARTIADEWSYPPPYDFYDAEADPEDYAELVTPEEWPEIMEQALDGGELVGFLAAERGEDDAWEIGLGMRPDLTGHGTGESFVRACLARLQELVPDVDEVVLGVAAFNERAIRVYERCGFVRTGDYDQETNGGVHRFVRMRLSA